MVRRERHRLTARAIGGLALAVVLVLVLGACSSGNGESGAADVDEPTTTTVPPPPLADVLADHGPGRLVEACEELAGGDTPTEPVAVLDDASNLQYCVGPAVILGLEQARSEVTPVGFQVALVFTDDGIAGFNELAGYCFEVDPDVCPTQRVALVAGETVLTAPAINAAQFERDQIAINGDYSPEEAEELARSLNEGGLEVRPVILDLGPAGS